MNDRVPIKTALLSVSDKTDLVPFANALASRGVRLVSTGGTAKALAQAGLKVIPVDQLTGFPEGLDGRVKTLHPKVHGGLLAVRDNPAHAEFLRAHAIDTIDLLCINLYPFQRTISNPDVTLEDAVENIDVGGPAMLRAGAKNHRWVTVVPSARRYDSVISELHANDGCTTLALRMQLAAETFAMTSEYDAAIAAFLSRRSPAPFPESLRLAYVKVDDLRYGENPHQQAALYRDPAGAGQSVVSARQLHGKQLSYNNINDAAAALETVKALAKSRPDAAGACVVKHLSPCGAAVAGSVAPAIDRAIAGDPLAAFGGILACNRPIDRAAAERLCHEGAFFEVVVAPSYSEDALDTLRRRWTNLRVLEVGQADSSTTRQLDYRSVPGGMLVQDRDLLFGQTNQWKHAAGPAPTQVQVDTAVFLEIVCRAALSNAVVIGGNEAPPGSGNSVRLFGLGGGQVDRLTSCRIAVEKAGASAKGAVAFSDAFFPFADGPKVLIDAGVSMLLHPGGSKRDQETFDLCNQRGVTCLLTGTRHFRH